MVKTKPGIPRTTLSPRNQVLPPFFLVLSIAAIIITGVAAYSNSFDCSFHFDDFVMIVNNTAFTAAEPLRALWESSPRRFIGYMTFALNRHINGLDVTGYHAVNLVIHLGAALLVRWLVMLLLSTPGLAHEPIARHKGLAALACALIFVSHPIQTQAVTYIVQRFASLAALLYLTSLCCYIRGRLSERRIAALAWFACSGAAALLGMFTKETSFTLPLAVLLCEFWLIRRTPLREHIRSKGMLVLIPVALAFAVVIPAMVLSYFHTLFWSVPSQRFVEPGLTNLAYFFTQFRVIPVYIRLLFFPVGLNLDHDFPASLSFFEPGVLAGFLFLVFIAVVTVFLSGKQRFTALGIAFFFLTLSVESSIIPLGNVMFEHRLYLPMAGFTIMVAGIVHALARGNPKVLGTFAVIATIAFASMTYSRNMVWENDISLWSDVVKKSPLKARSRLCMGTALFNSGDMDGAILQYRKALEIYPRYADAFYSMGTALLAQGRNGEAAESFREALRIDQYHVDALVNLGAALFRLSDIVEARRCLEQALAMNPKSADAHNNLGIVLASGGDIESALPHFREAVSLDPENAESRANLRRALDGAEHKP